MLFHYFLDPKLWTWRESWRSGNTIYVETAICYCNPRNLFFLLTTGSLFHACLDYLKGGGGRGRCEELGMSKGFLDRFTDNSVEDANEYRNSFGTKQTVVGNTYSILSRIAWCNRALVFIVNFEKNIGQSRRNFTSLFKISSIPVGPVFVFQSEINAQCRIANYHTDLQLLESFLNNLKASDTDRRKPTPTLTPHACAQPYHSGSCS